MISCVYSFSKHIIVFSITCVPYISNAIFCMCLSRWETIIIFSWCDDTIPMIHCTGYVAILFEEKVIMFLTMI